MIFIVILRWFLQIEGVIWESHWTDVSSKGLTVILTCYFDSVKLFVKFIGMFSWVDSCSRGFVTSSLHIWVTTPGPRSFLYTLQILAFRLLLNIINNLLSWIFKNYFYHGKSFNSFVLTSSEIVESINSTSEQNLAGLVFLWVDSLKN